MHTQTDARRNHRREVLLGIALPFGGAVVLLLVGLLMVLLQPQTRQVSLIADLLLIIFMLCPLALCLFPLALGLTAAAWAMNSVHSGTERQLGRLVTLSQTVSARVQRVSDAVAQRAIAFGVSAAPLERVLLGIFDRVGKDDEQK